MIRSEMSGLKKTFSMNTRMNVWPTAAEFYLNENTLPIFQSTQRNSTHIRLQRHLEIKFTYGIRRIKAL
jgi:hypothetical protein